MFFCHSCLDTQIPFLGGSAYFWHSKYIYLSKHRVQAKYHCYSLQYNQAIQFDLWTYIKIDKSKSTMLTLFLIYCIVSNTSLLTAFAFVGVEGNEVTINRNSDSIQRTSSGSNNEDETNSEEQMEDEGMTAYTSSSQGLPLVVLLRANVDGRMSSNLL